MKHTQSRKSKLKINTDNYLLINYIMEYIYIKHDLFNC